MTGPVPAEGLEPLRAATARFAAVLAEADLEAAVAHCPGWSVRDLAVHLGGIHQWAAHAVVAGSPGLEPEEPDIVGRDALVAWYAAEAAALLDVLAERGADGPAWTMDPADPTAGFWRRRQLHETALHTWDVEHAVGRAGSIELEVAWDGVLEVAEVMYPRQVRLGRIEPLRAVRLVAEDAGGDVVLGVGEPVELRAPAEVLLRLLWHRATPAEVAPAYAGGAGAILATAVTP